LAAVGEEVTDVAVARIVGVAPEAIPGLRRAAEPMISLDQTIFDGEEKTLFAVVEGAGPAPEAELLDVERTANVADALGQLPRQTRRVLELRYGLGKARSEHSLGETARKLHLTRERVRQLEHEGLRALTRAQKLKALAEEP
jgi:RNA polymerase sigma factor (sigma-70 family)